MRLPIRTRLTLVFAGLMLVVLAGSGAFLYFGLASELDATIDRDLESLSREFVADVSAGETSVLEDFGVAEPEGSFAQILDRDGRILEHTHAVAEPLLDPEELGALDGPSSFDRTVTLRSGPDPARLVAAPATEGKVVVVGAILEERNAALASLAVLLWTGGPVLLVIVSGLAWLLSGAALRPVERMRRETAAISEGDLAKRLQVPPTGDEVASLAATLNEMLARLEWAFERERRFVDDASHELRTPLGILKTELELALRRARTKEELEAALASAAEESERLNRLAEDLLVLARSEKGRLPLKRSSVAASALVHGTTDLFHGRAREHGVTIDVSVSPDLKVEVDEVRIQQALGNLIANALSHTPDGGSVRVAATANGAEELVLSVADSGCGFPDAFIAKAFDPFTRADAGRSRRDGGAGLGLAIVRGVAEAHGGSVRAANRPEGGAIVTLRIPA